MVEGVKAELSFLVGKPEDQCSVGPIQCRNSQQSLASKCNIYLKTNRALRHARYSERQV